MENHAKSGENRARLRALRDQVRDSRMQDQKGPWSLLLQKVFGALNSQARHVQNADMELMGEYAWPLQKPQSAKL